jgi:hypothetical protein
MKSGHRIKPGRAGRREAPLTEAEIAQAAAQAEALNAARLAEGGDPGIWSPAEARRDAPVLTARVLTARWPLVALALAVLALLVAAPVLALELAMFGAPVAAVVGAALLTRRWLRARRLGAGV